MKHSPGIHAHWAALGKVCKLLNSKKHDHHDGRYLPVEEAELGLDKHCVHPVEIPETFLSGSVLCNDAYNAQPCWLLESVVPACSDCQTHINMTSPIQCIYWRLCLQRHASITAPISIMLFDAVAVTLNQSDLPMASAAKVQMYQDLMYEDVAR